ncbi:hypothetical protein TNCV_2244481 [Trichonephila clavipes]|nr:hypothetical protein TNCV_2244481 [Trichonephila clavipes]
MAVCKCIVPLRHGVLQIAVEPLILVRLVEGEERWETSDHPQGVPPQNWGGTEQNFKAKANDRRYLAKMNFGDLDLTTIEQ